MLFDTTHTRERQRDEEQERERIYFDPMENDQMVNEWDQDINKNNQDK